MVLQSQFNDSVANSLRVSLSDFFSCEKEVIELKRFRRTLSDVSAELKVLDDHAAFVQKLDETQSNLDTVLGPDITVST